jgi:predicted ATPase/class 3 adenylate cyclase
MTDLPSGTVTFLFTDIEGSTRLWEQDRAAMQMAVERHLHLLRAAIEAHGGMLFKVVGDAVQAAFPTAPDAVVAAVEAQRALLAEPWDKVGPLQVRMALHAGDAVPRDGDYLAAPLNRLARLLAAGHGTQIVLTEVIERLVADVLPAGVRLRPLGTHRLRDLHEPEDVFQVVASGLPERFPPLRSLPQHPTNLTVPPTTLIGREAEVVAVLQLFETGGARLVTLTGPGGTGKTRLALEIAAQALDRYSDGVFFVDLSPLTDPDLVVPTIGATLGVREVTGQPLLSTLTDFLTSVRMLLVLDNFEHVLSAAPEVAALVAASPSLAILATSREPLHLRGEREFPVFPLPLPAAGHLPAIEELARVPAVALFLERAIASQPDFALTTDNATAVAAICKRLDGLPLAIELVAAKVKVLSPAALLARLEHRLPLLTGGGRDLPPRQRTMRDAIAWSHDLLAPEGRALFARLGVFTGGWTIEAAEAVSEPQRGDVLDGLARLVDQSLVQRTGEPNDEPRFGMLETIQEYAREQLAVSSDRDAVYRRHTAHFLALAERAKEMIGGPHETIWLARLAADQDNLRVVFQRAIDTGNADTALRLGAALWRFWAQRGHLGEGRTALERALGLEGEVDAAVRASAIYYLGNLALDLNEHSVAQSHFMECLATWQRLDNQDGIASALNGLGLVARDLGEYARARNQFEEALQIWSAVGDERGIAIAQHNLGTVAAAEGAYERAQTTHEEALSLHRKLGNADGVAYSLWGLATVARLRGDAVTAQVRYRESLAIFKDHDDQQGEAYVLHGLAQVAQLAGADHEALLLYREALTMRQALGERNGLIEGIEGVAAVVGKQGGAAQAARLLGAAASLRAATGLAPTMAERLEQEQSLAIARRSLSGAEFAEAWAAGQALSREEATTEALRLIEQSAVAP